MALFQKRILLRAKPEDQKYGLVVGPREIIITKPGKKVDGVMQPEEILFDGLKEAEEAYRKNGKPPVTFEDHDNIIT
jgi:hypothetical protein